MDGELEVGPCTECLHCCVLTGKDTFASLAEHGINTGEVEIAVLNDSIVVRHLVVGIIDTSREVCQLLEVGGGILSDFREVASDFTQEDSAVSQLLNLVDDAQDGIHGVVWRVEVVVLIVFH